MVKAILDGRKTQTRRLIKNSLLPKLDGLMFLGEECLWAPHKPGDHLWVRETYALVEIICNVREKRWLYKADDPDKRVECCRLRICI